MRNVYLTKRQQRESLKTTKAQLEIEKNYSIRDLNFIYTFLIFHFHFPAIFLPWLPQDASDDNASENL